MFAMHEKQEKPKRLRKGQARIEYFAVVEEIKELAAKGFDLTAIHQQLTKSGKITMSYKGLYENHNYLRLRQKKKNGTQSSDFTNPLKTGQVKKQPGSVSATSTMPTDKILSLDEIMQKNLRKSQAFTESQALPDENPEDRETQMDKHIGGHKN